MPEGVDVTVPLADTTVSAYVLNVQEPPSYAICAGILEYLSASVEAAGLTAG